VEGRCVFCKASDQCGGGAPICSAFHACASCAAVDAGCPSATPACEADSGRCLECLGDGDCASPKKPVCLAGGTCAECASSDDCKVATKPICAAATNICVACTSDAECVSKGIGPGVCLFHLDGHCATDGETVYVGKTPTGTCSDTSASAGTAMVPYCTAQTGVGMAKTANKPVVVLLGQVSPGFSVGALSAPLSIVGKSAVLTPNAYADGITVTGGTVYLRGLTVGGNPSGTSGTGIVAQASVGATLSIQIDGCTVKNNPGGGILLAGASFDIRNASVTGNGPGQTTGGVSWGGIRAESLPAGGVFILDLVTIQSNLAPGLSCSDRVQGQGVLASGNTLIDIANSCLIGPCSAAGPDCGAQP